MKKRILVGSIFVLTLLLLMPSIPAIQQKAIEDKAYNDLKEQVKNITISRYKDKLDLNDNLKHPLLYLIVSIIDVFFFLRAYEFFNFVFENFTEPHFKWGFIVTNPFLFLIGIMRLIWLGGTSTIWFGFWVFISDTLGWNWDLLVS